MLKPGKKNVVVDALSRRYTLQSILQTKILGLYTSKELYKYDDDFQKISANPRFTSPIF